MVHVIAPAAAVDDPRAAAFDATVGRAINSEAIVRMIHNAVPAVRAVKVAARSMAVGIADLIIVVVNAMVNIVVPTDRMNRARCVRASNGRESIVRVNHDMAAAKVAARAAITTAPAITTTAARAATANIQVNRRLGARVTRIDQMQLRLRPLLLRLSALVPLAAVTIRP